MKLLEGERVTERGEGWGGGTMGVGRDALGCL